jgi:hypothetical protein
MNTLTFTRPAQLAFARLIALGALLILPGHALVQAEEAGATPVAAAPAHDINQGDLLAFVELARSDIRTEKAMIYAENMSLTPDEASEFWPLQREYDLEANKILDRRVALIMKFGPSAKTMTDDQAKAIAKETFDIEAERTSLKRKYFQSFSEVISPVKAARFFQIENQLNMAIDLQLASELPLISRAK